MENTLASDRPCWFAARTRCGAELGVRDRLDRLGTEHFLPVELLRRTRSRATYEHPLIPGLIFVRATKKQACALTNDCIHFPVANLRAIIDDGRTFLNGAPLHTLVFTYPFAVALVSQGPRHFEERQWKLVRPKHVVERLGTGNLFRRKQLIQPGIANTSIQ